MKKNILISLVAVLCICITGVAKEDYQIKLSDKQDGNTYQYDAEYETLLKRVRSLLNDNDNDNDQDTTSSNNLGVDQHENDYDELIAQAAEILGKEKVSSLTSQVDDIVFDATSKLQKTQANNVTDNAKNAKQQKVYVRDSDDIISDTFALNNDNTPAKSIKNTEDIVKPYESALAKLNKENEMEQLFNSASQEMLASEEYDDEIEEGYPVDEITTVGLFKGQEKHFNKCLLMKKYGGGTWRTYCQPIAKPTQCTVQQWRDLSTMPIMFC